VESSQLLLQAQRLQALAQAGLAYAINEYDLERYQDFQVAYPLAFIAGRVPENGDGGPFLSPDGLTTISVSGSNGPASFTEELDATTRDVPGIVTGTKLFSDRFLVFWTNREAGMTGLVEEAVGSGSMNRPAISFPTGQGSQYTALVSNIAASFRPGDLDSS
jgi:Hydrolase of X-linked nucleoside diphosphate N terminal